MWTTLANLGVFKAEQAPFLFTYNGTNYYDEDPAQYIEDNKIQRGNWRELDIDNDFLGYDPPSPIVYTGISGAYYCMYFAVLYAIHVLALFVMKKFVSLDFNNTNVLEQLLHAMESTNFGFSLNDWDFRKSGGPSEHYAAMKSNQKEVIWNIVINFISNCILLMPLPCLCECLNQVFVSFWFLDK